MFRTRPSLPCPSNGTGCHFFFMLIFLFLVSIQIRNHIPYDRVSTSKRERKLLFHELQQQEEEQKKQYYFKILQLADLHLGEPFPQQDVNSSRVIQNVIQSEKPDLVVLSGDQLTANNINTNATAYYRVLIDTLINAGVNDWCMIFGNHDDQAYQYVLPNGTKMNIPAKTTRQDLIELDMSYKGSWTQKGPQNIFGTSNYVIPLYLNSNDGDDDDAVSNIYLFDSGGGSLPKIMQQNQIDWYRSTFSPNTTTTTTTTVPNIPSVAFQHIPTNENFRFQTKKCHGMNGDGGIDSLVHDPGLLEAFMEHGNMHFLGVGHNHGNDYCCKHSSTLHLCFGRHSGYGGYGTWDRGARVYQLELTEASCEINDKSSSSRCFEFVWRSWVRLENGSVIDHYRPEKRNFQ